MADFQNIKKGIQNKYEEDLIQNDGALFLHSRDYFNWLSRMQYNKRCKNDPIYLFVVLGGINPVTKEVFLGLTNPHGTKLEENFFITGLGAHYC